MQKNTVYITGHRNPDMDTLCSSLGYAVLKNLIDPRNEYTAVRCSHLNDGTKRLMSLLGVAAPAYMKDVYPKVSDVMITSGQKLEASESLMRLAESYDGFETPTTPVFDQGIFYGLVTPDAIADWTVRALQSGKDLNNVPTVGEVTDRRIPRVQTDELFEDAKKRLQNSSSRGIAVFDRDGKYAGYATRRCFLDTPRYNVIMVDHNEREQSIKGIETANICEIIDHHRLNALKTDLPLFIDAEPLGSTCTIVYQMYLRNGIRPDKATAKILLTGILTDTLILRSPTATRIDRDSADALSAISGLDCEQFGKELFNCMEGLKKRDPAEAIGSDFKEYKENTMRIGIGQCEVTTLSDLDEYADAYLEALESVRKNRGLDWAVLMITDVVKERSVLLSTNARAAASLPYQKTKEGRYDMPGVLSRKKQLLPEILHCLNQ